MSFRISSLPVEPFQSLFGLSDEERIVDIGLDCSGRP